MSINIIFTMIIEYIELPKYFIFSVRISLLGFTWKSHEVPILYPYYILYYALCAHSIGYS